MNHCEFLLETIDQSAQKDDQSEEEFYKVFFDDIRSILNLVSQELRLVNTRRILIPPLCDTLVLFSMTETYFTPTETHRKIVSDQVFIRKCDVKSQVSGKPKNTSVDHLDAVNEEKTAYKGYKEYDSSYVWG